MTERHSAIKDVLRFTLRAPGSQGLARASARAAIRLPLSTINRQRIFNLVAPETIAPHPVSCVMDVAGTRLRLDLDLRDNLSRKWFFYGYLGYEAEVVQLVHKVLRPGMRVLEVGANVGYFTLLMAVLVGDGGEIHAFEPVPFLSEAVRRAAAANGLNQVRVETAAASDMDGVQALHMPLDGDWTNASLLPGPGTQAAPVDVQTRRLDSYCRSHAINHVDLVKIDAEGADPAVLAGMGDLLLDWRPAFLVEVLQTTEDAIDAYFSAAGYRKFSIQPGGLEEVPRVSAGRYRDYYFVHPDGASPYPP